MRRTKFKGVPIPSNIVSMEELDAIDDEGTRQRKRFPHLSLDFGYHIFPHLDRTTMEMAGNVMVRFRLLLFRQYILKKDKYFPWKRMPSKFQVKVGKWAEVLVNNKVVLT